MGHGRFKILRTRAGIFEKRLSNYVRVSILDVCAYHKNIYAEVILQSVKQISHGNVIDDLIKTWSWIDPN